eukprot:Rhum_TRINITY_DN14427_c11_g5::Rhum_TRINITY_DN14427_c11_g5_i1::g.89916::m.89916
MPLRVAFLACVVWAAVLRGAAAQCGQGPSSLECVVRSDIALPYPVVDGSAVSLNETVFVFQRAGGTHADTLGLATAGGQKWSRYDALPFEYLIGKQMAVLVFPEIWIFPSASRDVRALPNSDKIVIFDSTKPAKSQFRTVSIDDFPKRTHSQAVAVGSYIYLSGGQGNSSLIRLDPADLAFEVIEEFDPPSTQFLFVSDTKFLYAVGGLDPKVPDQWTQTFYVFDIEKRQPAEMLQELYRPVEDISGTMIGPYIYIIDWNTSPLTVGIWSNYSKVFTNYATKQGVYLNRTNFASAWQVGVDGTGMPKVYILGGLEGDEVKDSLKVYDVSTGIELPKFSLIPASPFAGQNASDPAVLTITLVGVTAKPATQLRLSRTVDCDMPLEGTVDAHYGDKVSFLLNPSAVGMAYICYSIGGCPDNDLSEPCSKSADHDADALGVTRWDEGLQAQAGGCLIGCCRVINPAPACLALTNESRDVVFFPLDTQPFRIHKYDPPTPQPETQAPTPAPTHVTLDKTMLGILLGCVLGALVLGTIVVYVCYVRLQPRREKKEIRITCSNDMYEPIEKLGSGSYGVVYLVKKKTDGQLFAMKYIACTSDDMRDEAMQEFNALRVFQGHPHMVRVVETFFFWTENGPQLGLTANGSGETLTGGSKVSEKTPLRSEIIQRDLPRYVCIVMAYYSEGDLKSFITSHIENRTKIPEAVLLSFIQQICSLLEVMHGQEKPVVHRDLKPENILLKDDRKSVVVTDFGLAKNIDQTYCNTQVGSLPYVAPECWERNYGTQVDLWSLGCIAYAAATRRCQAHNTRVMFSDMLRDEVRLRQEIATEMKTEGYSEFFTALLLSLLSKDRHDRPSAKDVVQLLNAHFGSLSESSDCKVLPVLAPQQPAHPSPHGSASSLAVSMKTIRGD